MASASLGDHLGLGGLDVVDPHRGSVAVRLSFSRAETCLTPLLTTGNLLAGRCIFESVFNSIHAEMERAI